MVRYDAGDDLGRYDFNAVSALCEAERCVRDHERITILIAGIDRIEDGCGLSLADKTRIVGKFCALQHLYVGAWSFSDIVMAKRAMESCENGKRDRLPRRASEVAVGIGWARESGGKLVASCDWFDDWSLLNATRAVSSPDVYGVKYLKGKVYEAISVCSTARLCAVRA